MKRYPIFINWVISTLFIGMVSSAIAETQQRRTSQSDQSSSEIRNLKRQLERQVTRIAELEAQLNQVVGMILPDFKMGMETLVKSKSQSDSVTIMIINRINIIQNKIKLLEDKAAYSDSTNFEVLTQLVMMENKITSMTRSFNELYALRSDLSDVESKRISSEDYRRKYIDALSFYKNSEFQNAIDGFSELVIMDSKHMLADNSQYWLGECYYSLKNYKRAILEFEKVLKFSSSDKLDDAQLKLGLCYRSIGNNERANIEFQKLLEYYPNSEYYAKARQYLRQL